MARPNQYFAGQLAGFGYEIGRNEAVYLRFYARFYKVLTVVQTARVFCEADSAFLFRKLGTPEFNSFALRTAFAARNRA
jgi:hypothetical protein